jgi:hypothetical protein
MGKAWCLPGAHDSSRQSKTRELVCCLLNCYLLAVLQGGTLIDDHNGNELLGAMTSSELEGEPLCGWLSQIS